MYMADPRVYWASEKNSKEVVDAAIGRIKRFRDRLETTGRLGRMRRSLNAYYGYGTQGGKDTSQVRQSGESGELAELSVNEYGALVQQALVLITGSKAVFKAVAVNSDYSSGAQATLADGLLENYDRVLKLADKDYEAAQAAILLGEGFSFMPWNPSLGKEVGVDPDSDRVQFEGDIESESKTIFDVAYDPDIRNWDQRAWVAVKRQGNKHDLAARYPKVAEELLAVSALGVWQDFNTDSNSWEDRPDSTDPDLIDYWELHHKPTPACPNGRLVSFVNSNIVMFDTYEEYTSGDGASMGCIDHGYPYDEIPLYRICPETKLGAASGHTSFFDLLALQEGIDLVATITMTTVNSSGLQNFWLPPGHNVAVTQIKGGMNLIESPVEPKAIVTMKLDPALENWAGYCASAMRRRIGINDVVMGETTKGMPAQLAALLRAQAIEYQSRLQAGYERYLEESRAGLLKNLKRYATGPRIATLAGKSKTWALKEFSAPDLADVERFALDPLNAMARSYAGRLEMVKDLMEMKAIQRPDQYINFMTTGRLDPLLEGNNANYMRLAQEKEMLMQGIGPMPRDPMTGMPMADGKEHVLPLKTDTHWIDIPEVIQSVLASPGARNNPAVSAAVFEYVDQHLKLWRANPDIAQAMGGPMAPPDPAMMQPGMPPPGGAAPSGGKPPMGLPGGGAQTSNGPGDGPRSGPPAPVPEGAPAIRLPKPPPNPLTGEQQESPSIANS